MILKDWLKKNNISPNRFSKMIGADPSTIYRTLSEEQKVTPRYAKLIEEATNGEVSRLEAIWPEDYPNLKKSKKKLEQINMFGRV